LHFEIVYDYAFHQIIMSDLGTASVIRSKDNYANNLLGSNPGLPNMTPVNNPPPSPVLHVVHIFALNVTHYDPFDSLLLMLS